MKEANNPNDTIHKKRYIIPMIVMGIIVVAAMIKIQWIDGNEWRERGNHRVESLRPDPAHRGDIFSSDGKILATTVPVCDLYLDLARWAAKDKDGKILRDKKDSIVYEGQIADSNFKKYIDKVCILLHRAVPERSVYYFKERILNERNKEHANRCFLVQRGIPYSVWMDICQIPGWGRGVVKTVADSADGHSVIRQVRAHIYGNLAENTIGFKNSILDNSYTGLEGYYDSILSGTDGLYKYRRLTKGVWMRDESMDNGFRDYGSSEDGITIDSATLRRRVDGQDIISTIDTRFQDIAESSLRKALYSYNGTSGCAILMEIKTGYVLACCNLQLDTSRHNYYELKDQNIACSDLYEPGSTFKTVILTAMMNDKTIHIDTADKVRVGIKQFTSSNTTEINDGSHSVIDTVSLPQMLAMSSNVGMCELGWKYYRDRRDILKRNVSNIFPYDPLFLDVKSNEPKGGIINLAPDRNFLNFCYGYSNKVSAMQLITFYNAIAGDGRMMKPMFCKAIGSNGKFREIEPIVLKEQICSPETAKILKTMLAGVVENGTGNNVKNNTYGIAGKTGTAVYNYSNQHRYSASFVGFFPTEQPKYTCLVIVKNVAVHGRQAAAPVFKRISDCVVAIDKELANVKIASEQDTVYAAPQPRQFVPTGEGLMPNCHGMTIRQALPILRKMGLKVKCSGYGKISSQTPKAGSRIGKNATVILTASSK